jgi:hypothetical protein
MSPLRQMQNQIKDLERKNSEIETNLVITAVRIHNTNRLLWFTLFFIGINATFCLVSLT